MTELLFRTKNTDELCWYVDVRYPSLSWGEVLWMAFARGVLVPVKPCKCEDAALKGADNV